MPSSLAVLRRGAAFSQFSQLSRFSLLLLLATACLDSTSPGAPSNPATETFATSLGVNIAQMTKLNDALYIQDVVVGTGAEAVKGKTLNVRYTGWLPNGTQFGTNVGGDQFPFVLGNQDVIEGWDLGLVGMHVGGKRRLVVGSDLGYGPFANGPIPANSTLVFDVELVSLK